MRKYINRKTITLIAGLTAAALFLYIILPVSVPLAVALLTAILLEPAVRFFQNRFKLGRKISVLIVFTSFILIIGGLGSYLATRLISESINFALHAPDQINEMTAVWSDVQDKFVNVAKEMPKEVVQEINNRTGQFLENIRDGLLEYLNINNLKIWLTNIPSYFISFLVYMIALFLFLLDLPRLRHAALSHLKISTAERAKLMNTRLSRVLYGFIKAQFLVSLIIFAISFISLSFIVPKTAFFISVIIWVIDFIPIIGSIVILGPWALFHLLSGSFALGIKLSILAAVLLIIRRTIEPKLMGAQIGLSPLATLVSMYLGIKILGLWGFLIGPMLLIIFQTAREAGLFKLNIKI
ncbi:sporulation integral membrane protein YtvI [Bacillus massilinigeriensis]|uniref:sporulation integral membrane protein YtvI n=1 Tax=Bacillus mediterraneensis TaxID=1805474 RepID=UPI0008F851D7|nr:sporulation integral membrane protein YtvI [Bacillus mediterraneensis]